MGGVLHAGDFNAVTGLDAEAPGVNTVTISGQRGAAEDSDYGKNGQTFFDAGFSFFGKRAAADWDTLFSAEKLGVVIVVQRGKAISMVYPLAGSHRCARLVLTVELSLIARH